MEQNEMKIYTLSSKIGKLHGDVFDIRMNRISGKVT